MLSEFKDGAMTFYLEGRIDSNNAAKIEQEIMEESSIFDSLDVAFDAGMLNYISSAGLRVLLKIKKKTGKDFVIKNVTDEVFDIFDVTGFSEIFRIERQMRTISLRGCKKISSALNGEIFQLSDDEMVKIYGTDVPLEEVKKERSYAQTAMALGVPTLIPYDVVKCEQGYGLVFEKAETTSLAYLISRNPDSSELYASMLAMLLRMLHHTEIPAGKLPDIKEKYRKWIAETDDPGNSRTMVFSNLIDSIPDSSTYVHGDINLNSVMLQDDELLLLDMSGSARGNAIFDLSSLFASLVAIETKDEGYCRRTFGLSKVACLKFWNKFFDVYLEGKQDQIKAQNQLLAKYFVLKESVLTKVEKKYSIKDRIPGNAEGGA